VFDGFNKCQYTISAFIDMEKAYDSVWRNGLLFKLQEQGISGKAWRWIRDFLHDREAYNALQGWNSARYTTKVGLPQGSVISPLLFNIYSKATGEKIKFADDGNIWQSGVDIKAIAKELEEDL
jgi:hypothetical protein